MNCKAVTVLIFAAQVFYGIHADEVDDKLTRQLSTGSLLRGRRVITNNGEVVHVYLSIPYAEPPVSQDRYKAPTAKKKWTGVLDASQYRVSCLYDSAAAEKIQTNEYMSEDCLHINVITTERCVEKGGCPVAVFFVGGEYSYGSPIIISAEELAEKWASNDIVVVTMNNRLGSFGFLNTRYKTSAVKNAGLLDQIEALRWIQNEIGTFGGDSGRVTLMGKGAGAINVDQLAISPATKGYFDQVALIGGASGMMPNIDADTNVDATRKLAAESGCDSGTGWTSDSLEDILSCLRSKDAGELLSIQRKLEDQSRMYSFKSPMLDGEEDNAVLPETIERLLLSRRGITMMIGSLPSSSGLTKITEQLSSVKSLQAWCQLAIKYRHLNNTEKLIEECIREYSKDPRKQDLIKDLVVFLPILESAYTNAKADGKTYLFDYSASQNSPDQMGGLLIEVNESQDKTSTNNNLRASIVAFIKNGDPSIGQVQWEGFDKKKMNYVLLSDTLVPRNVEGYHREAVNFWDGTALKYSQGSGSQADYSSTEEHGSSSGGTSAPQKMPNGTWSIAEIRDIVKTLIESAMNQNQKLGNATERLNEWNWQMTKTLEQLQTALKNLESVLKAEWMKSYTEDQQTQKTTRKSEGEQTTKETSVWPVTQLPPEWQRRSRSTRSSGVATTASSWVVIRGRKNDDSTSVEVKIPPNAYQYFEEIIKTIDEFFDKLMENSTSSKSRRDYSAEKSEEAMNDVHNVVKRSVSGSIKPVIVPAGNTMDTYPTVPAVTVTSHWWNSAWFWVIHIISVILIVALIAYTCSLYRKYKRRLQYEHVH